jgi:sulfoxide reductase catalytic subunit YedY
MNGRFSVRILAACFILVGLAILSGVAASPHGSAAAAASQGNTRSTDGLGTDEDAERVYMATKDLHTTGIPQDVNIATWRLRVEGERAGAPVAYSYEDLKNMSMVRKEVVLVCPGFFTDRAEWEGVPLSDILDPAQPDGEYEKIVVFGLDGYQGHFSREDVENHLIFIALKVNGVILPKEHGYPARVVAEDIRGGKWVKWIDRIEVR